MSPRQVPALQLITFSGDMDVSSLSSQNAQTMAFCENHILDKEIVLYPLVPPIVPMGEDVMAGSAVQLVAMKDDRPSWECYKCGEENPGKFGECWKCQKWRAGDDKQSGDDSEKVE